MLNRLYELLIEHLVLFLPAQALTPATLLAFAETFGELDTPHHVYPHVPGYERVVLLENDGDRRPNTDVWHTDLTFKQNPPFAAILHAKAIPASGGDTLWCSMYAAYEALPDGMKADLRGLSAVHATGSYWNQFFAQGGIQRLNEGMAAMGAAVHPVIAHHPVTGKPFLNVNRHFTTHVLGMSSGDSQRLLTALFDHINQPDFQVRFRWHTGTVAIWDNRVTQHYAVADYLPHYRCMHRVTVVNDRRSPGK
jgi:taurine dioxygenase